LVKRRLHIIPALHSRGVPFEPPNFALGLD